MQQIFLVGKRIEIAERSECTATCLLLIIQKFTRLIQTNFYFNFYLLWRWDSVSLLEHFNDLGFTLGVDGYPAVSRQCQQQQKERKHSVTHHVGPRCWLLILVVLIDDGSTLYSNLRYHYARFIGSTQIIAMLNTSIFPPSRM